MHVLESNVEALPFNYSTFRLLTALNNLWTWLALLTAALSFWKFRSEPKPKPVPIPKPEAQYEPVQVSDSLIVEKTAAARNSVAEDVDGVTKGKFTVYYEEETDMQCRCQENERRLTAWEEEEEEEREREGSETEWWRRWEGLARLRNGESENGWYRWQDSTELNGNVVRFWEGARESCRYNSSCIHVWC